MCCFVIVEVACGEVLIEGPSTTMLVISAACFGRMGVSPSDWCRYWRWPLAHSEERGLLE